MHDFRHHDPQCDGDPPDGAGATLAILGGLATLPLIAAAVISGKSLWVVLAIWALGGPAMTLALCLLALRRCDGHPEQANIPSEGAIRHV